ncbi:UCH-domain-containing protein [Ascobolus immersus RN42]|uniref:ubiquitinyl hydrolase 1 n=1 Tax=Ascobolus immersus RN42 TaxID=1160509 RepID=A0A3N4I641_ASCIM|nr:UCH-domain-containing protein [Ascobolus immersus RN42]
MPHQPTSSETSPQQNQNSTPLTQSVPPLSTDSTSALGNIALSKGPTSAVLNREQDNFSATKPRPHSPLKRLASELNTDHNGDPLPEEDRQLSKRPSNHLFRDSDQDQDATMEGTDESLNGTNAAPQPQSQQPSTTSSNGTPSTTDVLMTPASSSSEFPSVDEQIGLVLEAKHKPLVEGDDFYIISCTWLQRFMNQGEDFKPSKDEDTPTPPGPIDNSDIAETAQKDLLSPPTDTAGAFKSMFPKQLQIPKSKLSSTPAPVAPANIAVTEDNPFPDYVALRPGTLGEDYEALPKEMWDMLVTWYGLAKNSPIIRRKVVNTAAGDEDIQNLTIELHPPVFTIQKLRSASALVTHKSLAKAPALTIVASKGEKYMHFLKRVKAVTSSVRTVKVWKIAPSAATTPRRSRSPSPAFGLGRKKEKVPEIKLEIDLKEFTDIPDSEKELVQLKDQTHNASYNGKATLDTIGLGMGGRLVIEEQDESKNWDSENVGKSSAAKQDQPTSLIKKMQNQGRDIFNSTTKRSTPTASPRSSSPTAGMMTRGRGAYKSPKPLGKCGLQNLGNTCYMNSALQCLRSVEELSKYFLSSSWKSELNPSNPLAHGGKVAAAYANLLNQIYDSSAPSSYCPTAFKNTIGRFGPSFSGYGQQDTQEFLAFLLDGLHEDLNRIHKKPYVEKPDSTDEMVGNPALIAELAQKCWDIYKARNDSAVADLFGGLYKSTLVCPDCQKVSITFDPFMDLTLPLPFEVVWTHEVVYVPIGQRPIRFTIELEKNKSIKDMKEYIGKRFSVDPKKLHVAEAYKSKFYLHYEDNKIVSTIPPGDRVFIYELQDVPTNFARPKFQRKGIRSMINIGPSKQDEEEEEEKARRDECLLVPVFSRIGPKKGPEVAVGGPFVITINKQENRDFDTIFRKVVEGLQSWTSSKLQVDDTQAHAESPIPQDTEMVEVDSKDDGETENSNITEEGYVNVQMSEETDKGKGPAAEAPLDTPSKFDRSKVPINLREIMKLRTTKGTKHYEPVPCGHSDLPDSSTPMINRLEVLRRPETKKAQKTTASDDEASPPPADGAATSVAEGEEPEMKDASDEDVDTPMTTDPELGSVFANPPIRLKNNILPPLRANSPAEKDGPLVRYQECIIIEWTQEGFESLFGGKSPDNPGFSYFDERSIELVRDEALERRRELRAHRKSTGVHLEDCLDEFAKEEILSADDPWYCPRCKEHRRASKKFELWKCPDILIIHLKRFSSGPRSREKLDLTVKFPIEGLDLTERVGDRCEGQSLIYDLIAVDNHYGGLGGGHYTAYAKNWADGKWYNFDDSHASQVHSPEAVVTPAAYLLFYRKRSSVPLGGPNFEKLAQIGSLPSHIGGRKQEGMAPSPSSSTASSRSSSPGAGPSLSLLPFGGAASNSTLFGPRPRNSEELPAYSQLPSDSEATINIGYTLGDGADEMLDIDAEMASGEGSTVSSVVELDTNDVDVDIPDTTDNIKDEKEYDSWAGTA